MKTPTTTDVYQPALIAVFKKPDGTTYRIKKGVNFTFCSPECRDRFRTLFDENPDIHGFIDTFVVGPDEGCDMDPDCPNHRTTLQ
jgi:hypothetical protein